MPPARLCLLLAARGAFFRGAPGCLAVLLPTPAPRRRSVALRCTRCSLLCKGPTASTTGSSACLIPPLCQERKEGGKQICNHQHLGEDKKAPSIHWHHLVSAKARYAVCFSASFALSLHSQELADSVRFRLASSSIDFLHQKSIATSAARPHLVACHSSHPPQASDLPSRRRRQGRVLQTLNRKGLGFCRV